MMCHVLVTCQERMHFNSFVGGAGRQDLSGLGDWIFVVIKYGPGTLELNGKSSHKQNVSFNVDVCRQDDAGICHFMLNDGFRWTLLVACRGQEG